MLGLRLAPRLSLMSESHALFHASCTAAARNDLAVFNLRNSRWSAVNAIGTLPPPRAVGAGVVSVNGSIYIFGGWDGSRGSNGSGKLPWSL